MTGRTPKVVLLALSAALVACAADMPSPKKPVIKPPVSAAAPAPTPGATAPESTYYRAVEAKVTGAVVPADLPLQNASIVRTDRAEARWIGAPEVLRDRVRTNGFAVLPGDGRRTRLGEYYVALHDARVPFVVTMDAMLQIAHMAIDRLLAEAEERTMAPALASLLVRVGARLDAESGKVTSDLDVAYDAARGLFAVARALLDRSYAPAPDLAGAVGEEVRRIGLHTGVQESTVLHVPIDYALLAPRGALKRADPEVGAYAALAWLALAPLALASRVDVEGAAGDVFEARTHTRAALLVARLLQADIDGGAAQAWDRIAGPLALVQGPPDDLSPRELVPIARRAGLDVRSAAAIQNVARIDQVRHASLDARHPRVHDGVRGAQVRVFGGGATADGEVLQTLVAPGVAGRTMPAGLDVAAWLGAAEARAVLRDLEPDLPRTYDVALAGLAQRRPPEEGRHESLVSTGFDALGAYLAASQADGVIPAARTPAWKRRKVEVALGGWATLRHDAVAFSRISTPSGGAPAATDSASPSALGFVEPHPEAIARVVALVEQAARGLVAMGAIAEPTPTSIAGGALELLRTCLAAAVREANDEALEGELAQRLSDLPARLAALETRLVPSRGDERPLAIDVHVDRATSRALEEALGGIDDLFLVLRESQSGRLLLTIGASLPVYELPQPAALALTDADWRARLRASPPPRALWTSAYVAGAASN